MEGERVCSCVHHSTKLPAPTFPYQRNHLSWLFPCLLTSFMVQRVGRGEAPGYGGHGRGPLKFKYLTYFSLFTQNTPSLCCHMFGDALVVVWGFSIFFIFFDTMATGRFP
ncbi:hypothetical protein E2C01_093750 [Portunus trituberculatus]|uniref:Uncharacterized protein n=1 Tax=Portunus trituberculatus TaxID=210409 RepID=A0A5B7JJY8_PORTR|nr:hypothetical protein [Portunus trituberculatus]